MKIKYRIIEKFMFGRSVFMIQQKALGRDWHSFEDVRFGRDYVESLDAAKEFIKLHKLIQSNNSQIQIGE